MPKSIMQIWISGAMEILFNGPKRERKRPPGEWKGPKEGGNLGTQEGVQINHDHNQNCS